jgi:protein-S-isoprenylcysteine O-methyltransferase Ste14
MPEVSLPNSADHANVRVIPPLIYVVVLGAAWLLQKLVPLPVTPLGLSRIGGGALIVIGLGLCWWSVGLFWSKHTSIIPVRPSAALVLAGPYRWTRNPMYLGLLLAYIGAALVGQLIWGLILLPIVVVALNRLVILKEERYLERTFGPDYANYRRQVRRWI